MRDANSDVRGAAATALGRLGDPQAADALARALKDPKTTVRVRAGFALRNLGWQPSTSEEQARFDIALGNPRAALRAGEAAVPPLASELNHDTSFQRRATAEALEGVSDPRAVNALLVATGGSDPSVRISAIYALAKEPSDRVANVLLKTIRDANPQVRLAAAHALTKRADPAHAQHFFNLLQDAHFEVRLAAVKFFARLRDPKTADALVPLLQDADSDVREAAAQALGAVGNADAVEPLVLALVDEERSVRQAAENALNQIDLNWAASAPAQRAAARIESAQQHKCDWVRPVVLQILGRLRAPGECVI